MQSAKAILDHLPEQVFWDDIMYDQCLKQKIEDGMADIEADRTILFLLSMLDCKELLSNLVYGPSGGDPVFLIDDLLSVAELDVVDDQFELPESLDALPPLLGALEQLEDHRQGGLA